jgi:glycine hydroxymethyltransferase
VLAATGSCLTNKYSEGYPHKRYYQGQQYIDAIETLAIDRAKALFGADHANVQPYSGSPANLAVYFALLQPGDTMLSMSLPHGGHLTHGWKVTISGRYFNAVQYGVRREDGRIDMDDVVTPRPRASSPSSSWCGASAYPRTHRLRRVPLDRATRSGRCSLADIAHIAGLVAAGLHPSPVGVRRRRHVSTTHKTLRGPRGGMILCQA